MEDDKQHSGVSARNEVEELLRKERDTAQRYLDVAGVILVALDVDERITLINRKGCDILGCSDQDLLGQNWFDRCLPESQRELVRRAFRRLMNGEVEPVERFENHVLTRDGRERLISWSNTVVRNANGEITGTLSSGSDITESNEADDRLTLLSSVVEQSSEGIAVVDLDGRLTYLNSAFAAMHGYTPDELVGKHLSIFHAPDQLPTVDAANEQIRREGSFIGEVWHMKRDGGTFPTLMHNTLLRDNKGAPVGMIGTVRDISERVDARRLLERSQAALARAQKIAHVGSWEWNMQPFEALWSDEMYEILGLDHSVAPAFDAIRRLTHPDDLAEVERVTATAQKDGTPFTIEFRIIRDDGSVRWLHTEAEMVFDSGGRPIQMFGTAQDITERKMAEQALSESEAMLRTAVESLPFDFFALDENGVYIMQNSACRERWGVLKGHPDDIQVPPEIKAIWAANNRRAFAGETVTGEVTYSVDGREEHIYNIIAPIYRDGKIHGILGVNIDISDRIRAERALRESEATYHDLVETSANVVYRVDTEGRFLFVNKTCKEVTGYDPEELVGRKFTEFQSPEDAARLLKVHGEHMTGMPINGVDTVFISKSGQPVQLIINARVFRDAGGQIVGGQGTALDITERNRAIRALQESEERYRSLYSSMNEGVALHEVVYNHAGRPVDYRLLDINSAYTKITGFDSNHAVGRLASELYQSKEPPYLQAFAAVAASGKPTQIEGFFEPLLKQMRMSIFSPELGRFAVVCEDITEREQARAELKRTHEQLQATLDALPDLLFELDRDGRILDFRAPEMSRLYLAPESFLGRVVTEIIPGPATETIATALNEAAETGHSTGRTYFLQDDTYSGWFELSIAAKGDHKSPDAHFIALVRDITERKRAEDSLREATTQLRKEREALAEKNIALKQVLEHIERERQDYKQRICQDIEQVVSPVLKHLKEKTAPNQSKEIESLHENLNVLLNRDVDVMQSRFGRLTPREQEICDLIRQGLSSKEISESLSLSILTVHKHREQIREKLGLTNKSINLSTFLRSH